MPVYFCLDEKDNVMLVKSCHSFAKQRERVLRNLLKMITECGTTYLSLSIYTVFALIIISWLIVLHLT